MSQWLVIYHKTPPRDGTHARTRIPALAQLLSAPRIRRPPARGISERAKGPSLARVLLSPLVAFLHIDADCCTASHARRIRTVVTYKQTGIHARRHNGQRDRAGQTQAGGGDDDDDDDDDGGDGDGDGEMNASAGFHLAVQDAPDIAGYFLSDIPELCRQRTIRYKAHFRQLDADRTEPAR